MGACHSSNDSSMPHDNLEIFSLIWLDRRSTKSPKNLSIQHQFRAIINYLKVFSNEIDCEEYIRQMSKNEHVVFIVNDLIGQKMISNVHHLPQIFDIYIYSPNRNTDQSWINRFPKIKSICTSHSELLNQIKADQTRSKYVKDEISFDICHTDPSTDSNDDFFFSQVLSEVLLQLNSLPADMNDFISLCRNQFKGNKVELNHLREFQQNYSSDQAISWLTRDTFISQLLNKALKISNLDVLFLLRWFLHDLEEQLKQHQCSTPITVYRHQLISTKQLELFQKSIGQFLSINGFFLTHLNRTSPLPFPKFLSDNNDLQTILFEITADPSLEKVKPFASLTSPNAFQTDHDCVLFMLGSLFQLDAIRRDEDNTWIIKMTLTSQTNSHLKSLFDKYKADDENEINLLSFGYLLQKMNKFQETENFYRRLFQELPDDDDRIGCCCLNLGNIAFLKNDYDSSLEWLFKSLDISIRTLPSNDTLFGLIYNSMAHTYNGKNDLPSALEYYNKAILIWKQSADENYLNLSECTNNIAVLYKQERDYILALEYFKKTLAVLQKHLPNDQFEFTRLHSNIASTYRQLGQYDLAVEHYHLSLKILEKCCSVDHPNIAKVSGNLGVVYALQGERHKALLYYEKAADIYRQTLPATHVNIQKIEQLIRNVSLTNRKVSFGPIETK